MLQYQNCHLPPRRGEEHLHTGFVPGKIICTSAGHWKVGRAEHQRQRAWDASEQGLGWKMSVRPKPREEIVWVYSHHTRRVGKDKPSVQGIFGAEQGPHLIPSEDLWVDSTWKRTAAGKGTAQAAGARTEALQHTNENQGLHQMVLKKVD